MQGTRTTYRSVIKRNCELNAVREIDTFYRRKFRVYSIPRDSREIFSVRFSSKFQEYQDSVKFKIFDSSTWKSNIETSLIHEQVKRASVCTRWILYRKRERFEFSKPKFGQNLYLYNINIM